MLNWLVELLKRERIFILSLLAGLVLIAFVAITLANMFYQQAKDIPGLIAIAIDPVVLKAIGISLSMALVATLVAFVFGVPLAYFLARKNFRGKSIIEGIVDVPLMDPAYRRRYRALRRLHAVRSLRCTAPHVWYRRDGRLPGHCDCDALHVPPLPG